MISEAPTIERIIASYLRAREDGQSPDRTAILEHHPQHAAELKAFFADCDRFSALFAPLALGGTTPDANTPVSLAGKSIGDYDLIEELGRGGMGVVYRARQRSLGREVAVKLMQTGAIATEAERLRFRAEAEVVASLAHPNIVPVYEVGEHEGLPYFSLKLFEGGSAAQHAGGLRDPRRAAGLVAKVARAIHHAHQRGVLHRDIKPGNVLLDENGEPHVTDFGLARRQGGNQMTAPGAIVGTPEYLSPEQARAERGLTTAVDVYGLGALLYALLTGRPPFVGENGFEVMVQVLESEPPRLRSLSPTVPRDLETVCLKCLQKEPNHRYASALALAEDVERWLAGGAILARRVGPVERVWKWVRRRPVIAALATALVVLLGVFLVVREIDNGKLRAALADVREQQEHTAAARTEAEAHSSDALAVIDGLLTRFSDEKLNGQPGMEELQASAYDEALKMYERLLSRRATDPEIRQRVAMGYGRVAERLLQSGENTAGLAAGKKAAALLAELADEFPDLEELPRFQFAVLLGIGQGQQRAFQHEEAETTFRSALALIEVARRRDKVWPRLDLEHGQALKHLASTLRERNRFAEAARTCQDAVKLLATYNASEPTREGFIASADALMASAAIDRRTGQQTEARKKLQAALTVLARLEGPTRGERVSLAGGHYELGQVEENLGQNKSAEKHYREAVTRFAALAKDFPTTRGYRNWGAKASQRLALLLHQTGRHEEARKQIEYTMELFTALQKVDPDRLAYQAELARSQFILGSILDAKDDPKAEGAFSASVGWYEKVRQRGPDSFQLRLDTAEAITHLALAQVQYKKPGEAARRFGDLLPLLDGLAKQVAAHPDSKGTLINITFLASQVGLELGQLAEARLLSERVLGWQLALPVTQRAANFEQQLWADYKQLLTLLGKQKDHEACARRAEEFVAHFPRGAVHHLLAGSFLTGCAIDASNDERLDPEERQCLADVYAGRAAELLRRAIALNGNTPDMREGLLKGLSRAGLPVVKKFAPLAELVNELELQKGK